MLISNTYYYLLHTNNDVIIENRKNFPFSHVTVFPVLLATLTFDTVLTFPPLRKWQRTVWACRRWRGSLPEAWWNVCINLHYPPPGNSLLMGVNHLGNEDVPQISIEFYKYLLTQDLLNYPMKHNIHETDSPESGAVLSNLSLGIKAAMS